MVPLFEFRRSDFPRRCRSRCKTNLFATYLKRSHLRIESFSRELGGRVDRIRFFHLLTVLTCAAISSSTVCAESADDSLLVYAVNIHRTPMQSWGPGYGIYLGNGLFVTAAHVAGHTWLTKPKVSIAGTEYPTKVVKAGDFETVDLTLLAVDEKKLPSRLALRRN